MCAHLFAFLANHGLVEGGGGREGRMEGEAEERSELFPTVAHIDDQFRQVPPERGASRYDTNVMITIWM